MFKQHTILFCASIILCQVWLIHSQCTDVKGLQGNISDTDGSRYILSKCWKIRLTSNQFLRVVINSLSFSYQQSCNDSYLRIKINRSKENYTFCLTDNKRNPVTALSDVEIEVQSKPLSVHRRYHQSYSFQLSYKIEDIECAQANSFRCSNHTCIPRDQVCDGVKNCKSGADEVGCGVVSIPGVLEARKKAAAWLISKRTPAWGWRENTPRIVTSLLLAGTSNYNGTSFEDELMVKQTEVKIAVTLLKSSLSNELLSMFINALLVTCHNPRRFYGQNLVKRLKEQVELSGNFTHPISYLALCNANESWPKRAITDLKKILMSKIEYPFMKDIQAFAVMAISCNKNNTKISNVIPDATLSLAYDRTIRRFKEHQLSDGSFGNVPTSALITQALLSGGQENAKDWKLNITVKYLIKELNSTHNDFYATYLTLPILNGKSLSDIMHVNCSSYPRKLEDEDLVSDIDDFTGSKMRVRYSLFVGDERDVIHTISLRVPENFTAYEVMKVAEVEDRKYKFEWKRVGNKMYVYKIGNVTNDPEDGKFWLLYVGSNNSTSELKHLYSDPDNVLLKDDDHFVMWYQKAEF